MSFPVTPDVSRKSFPCHCSSISVLNSLISTIPYIFTESYPIIWKHLKISFYFSTAGRKNANFVSRPCNSSRLCNSQCIRHPCQAVYICSFCLCSSGASYLSRKSSPRKSTSSANLIPLGTVSTEITRLKRRSGIKFKISMGNIPLNTI